MRACGATHALSLRLIFLFAAWFAFCVATISWRAATASPAAASTAARDASSRVSNLIAREEARGGVPARATAPAKAHRTHLAVMSVVTATFVPRVCLLVKPAAFPTCFRPVAISPRHCCSRRALRCPTSAMPGEGWGGVAWGEGRRWGWGWRGRERGRPCACGSGTDWRRAGRALATGRIVELGSPLVSNDPVRSGAPGRGGARAAAPRQGDGRARSGAGRATGHRDDGRTARARGPRVGRGGSPPQDHPHTNSHLVARVAVPVADRHPRRGLAEDRRAFCRRLVTPSEAKLPVDETKRSTKMSVADAKCPCGGNRPVQPAVLWPSLPSTQEF